MAVSKFIKILGNKKSEESAIQTSTGVAQADQYVATDATGKIDVSLMPVGFGDESFTKQASEALSTGDFVNVFDDLGVEKLRKADASSFSTRAIAFITNNYIAGDLAIAFDEGVLGGFAGLTIGQPVFLDTITAGGITQTAPTGTGEIWQKLGVAVSATEVKVDIEDPTELA